MPSVVEIAKKARVSLLRLSTFYVVSEREREKGDQRMRELLGVWSGVVRCGSVRVMRNDAARKG